MAPRTPLALFVSLNLLFFTYTSATTGTCPKNSIEIGTCVTVLNLVDLTLGNPPVKPCCSLIQGLADLEAAVCLCTALKASILGIVNINLPINLSVLLNVCSRNAPKSFQCA
nr:putative cell wall-plasma membrane disconnecting CLCT protein (AIR1A) [Arabidopsis thaliana]